MPRRDLVRWFWKPAVFVLCLLPFILLAFNFLTDRLSANPLSDITNATGLWTLRFLVLTIAVTPLRRLLTSIPKGGWASALPRFRRMLGLFAFFSATLHLFTYLYLDKFFVWGDILADLTKRRFIIAGATTFLLILPLALTSFNRAMRWLGGKRWKRLHRLAYLAAICGVVHYYWLVKADTTQPLIYGAIVGILLLVRVGRKRGEGESGRLAVQTGRRAAGGKAVLVLTVILASPLESQTSYFYKGYGYGSDAAFNPVSFILNSGFDELQMYGHSAALRNIRFADAGRNVWKNITAPGTQIDRYGAARFLRNEIVPASLDTRTAQWFPNYTLHLLGGGMAARKAAEWYEARGIPMPGIAAAITSMTGHYVNEIIENGNVPYFYPNVDPIADLLLFDPLGIILFTNDDVAQFFADELSFNDWSSQPAFSFGPLALRNASQNFVMKYPLTTDRTWSIFYHFGAFGMLGLTHRFDSTDALSVGCGVSSKKVYVTDVRNNAVTHSIVVGPVGGIYYDRNNSLLAALVIADSFTETFRLNVYPGLVDLGAVSPGFFCSIGKSGLTAGVNVSWAPVGVAGHR